MERTPLYRMDQPMQGLKTKAVRGLILLNPSNCAVVARHWPAHGYYRALPIELKQAGVVDCRSYDR